MAWYNSGSQSALVRGSMKQNQYVRYCITALPFLVVWFGAHIFGQAVWHFAVVNVERWWSHGVDGDIGGGLAGAAVIVVKQANRAKKAAVAENRRRQSAQFVDRASQRERAGRGAE